MEKSDGRVKRSLFPEHPHSTIHFCVFLMLTFDSVRLFLKISHLFYTLCPLLHQKQVWNMTTLKASMDYSGLVIQFDIRYCDPSCFVLLSQNCCSSSGSFMVPYKFLKCLFYICEICHRYFNRDCIESINHFG